MRPRSLEMHAKTRRSGKIGGSIKTLIQQKIAYINKYAQIALSRLQGLTPEQLQKLRKRIGTNDVTKLPKELAVIKVALELLDKQNSQ